MLEFIFLFKYIFLESQNWHVQPVGCVFPWWFFSERPNRRGNNLHNFDALILILLIMVAYGLSGKIAIDYDHSRSMPQMIKISLIGLLLILPLYKSLSIQPSFAKDIAEEEVKEFHDRVESDTLAGKSVLLIDEPHLIAFDFWGTPRQRQSMKKSF